MKTSPSNEVSPSNEKDRSVTPAVTSLMRSAVPNSKGPYLVTLAVPSVSPELRMESPGMVVPSLRCNGSSDPVASSGVKVISAVWTATISLFFHAVFSASETVPSPSASLSGLYFTLMSVAATVRISARFRSSDPTSRVKAPVMPPDRILGWSELPRIAGIFRSRLISKVARISVRLIPSPALSCWD